VQIAIWGKEHGKVGRFDELRAGAGCVAPPPAGDDDGGLAGLGFGEVGGGRCVALESPKRSDARVPQLGVRQSCMQMTPHPCC
jgi:hypothetical protein